MRAYLPDFMSRGDACDGGLEPSPEYQEGNIELFHGTVILGKESDLTFMKRSHFCHYILFVGVPWLW